MMSTSTFTLIVAVATIYILSSLAGSIRKGDMGTLTMVYLGTVDGKSYFVEDTPLRNWTDALKACNISGMKMAKITSSAQATLILNANLTAFHYWLGGRDTFTVERFVWDDDLTTPNASILSFVNYLSMYGCLAYNPNTNWHSHLCTSSYGTLCEVNHG